MKALEIIAVYEPESRPIIDFGHRIWQRARRLSIDRLWNGQPAPAELQTTALVQWSSGDLIIGFECAYTELDIDEECDLNHERYGLWDRDVCEAFIQSPLEPHEKSYREFEVAPTGQWIDLKIDRQKMIADWRWRSGMRIAHQISEAEHIWRAVFAIPFSSFDCRPVEGDIWKANLFRVSRFEGQRQFMAFSPTLTEKPNYHVPERFADLRFI